MLYLYLLNNSTTNGTVDPGVGEEMMGMAYSEITMIFWAVVAIVGVVGCIAYTTAIPSMKVSGRNLILASVAVSAMFYILPGLIHEIEMLAGW